MTPRTVVRSAPASETFEEFFESNREQRFSRIPSTKTSLATKSLVGVY